MNEYDITAAFEVIEQELISSMIRNMDRHRAEEIKEGYDWSMWQTEQLKALEKYKLENQKKYSKQFKSINAQIGELIWQAKQQGGLKQEEQILRAIKKGFKNYKPASAAMQAEFFKLNTRKLEALIKATSNDMKKAETAVLRMANDQYRKAIFNAQVYANSGAGTYEKAIDMATKDMLSRGLNCIEYKNGARHTLPDYVDMAIQTASKRAYLQGEGEKRQEWGISTVIVAKRGNPCPKCLPFVGKVLIDDVWSSGKASDGPYPLMSMAIARGLYHPRCKDSHSTYFPGISTADDTWTREELKSIEKSYKQEQDQQYTQRQVEKLERLAVNSLDKENQKKYKAQTEKQRLKLNEEDILKHAKKFDDRQTADGYHRPITEKMWEEFNDGQKKALWRYTGSEYREMNTSLRQGTVANQRQSIQDYIKDMTEAIDKCQMPDDVWVRRGVSANGLGGLLEIDVEKLKSKDFQNSVISTKCTEKGFMSTGVSKEAGFSGINLDICLPKGTKAIYAEPFSRYGGTNSSGTWDGKEIASHIGSEAEIIVQRNSTFRIMAIDSDETGIIKRVELLLIKQDY
ncbi:phage minor capsid protein [Lacrimispora sp.]|uniref:phage minor capsid protein n=1 Tax=Lacrimispora sp. TaxID=2719234 RepID=UPI0028A63BE5|nr:phage minor capsid protein [Lacrimispora sp.]